ncbi:hypothetical protein QLH51_06595 [Sphingomonas sp. 2R-10]|nr:hypothetical protein [Sphingomonas sp. 2R-10]
MAGIGGVLTLLCGWLLIDSVATSLAAWRGGAAEVRVGGGDAAMAVALPILLALAIWGMLAAFHDGPFVTRIGNAIAVVAIVAVPVGIAGSWAVRNWAEHALATSGYARCDTERTGRFLTIVLCRHPAAPARS